MRRIAALSRGGWLKEATWWWRSLFFGATGIWPLLLAVATAAGGVAAVVSLSDRLAATLQTSGGDWLAGDLLVVSPQRVSEAVRRETVSVKGARGVESLVTTSIVRTASGKSRLVTVRAVEEGYPLRGQVVLRERGKQRGGPAVGTVWIEERLARELGIGEGTPLGLGMKWLPVEGIVVAAPEQGTDFASLLPEVMVALPTFAETGLLVPGSRVSWRWHAVAPPAERTRLRDRVTAVTAAHERLMTPEESQPALASLLTEFERFLRVTAVTTVVLAAMALLLATRRVATSLTPTVALLRALGASHSTLTLLVGGGITVGAIGAAAVGLGIGEGIAATTAVGLAEALGRPQLERVPSVAWEAAAVGVVLSAAALAPWFVWLVRLPPSAVWRGEITPPTKEMVGMAVVMGVGVTAVVVAVAREITLALATLATVGGVMVLFGGVGWGLLTAVMRATGDHSPLVIRVPLLLLHRRPWVTITQVAALAVGLTAVWMLWFIRNDLLEAWASRFSAEAPDRFVLNVTADQVAAVATFLREQGVKPPRFWPMVRGRLVAIDGQPIPAELLKNPRAERLAQREFNLSYSTELPSWNRIVAGRWHGETEEAVASVEAGLAELFGLRVGSRVTFLIEAEEVTVTIGSIRALRWESMLPNFFFITTPKVLTPYAATWLAAFQTPSEQSQIAALLTERFPNVTVVDVGAMRQSLVRLSEEVVEWVRGMVALAIGGGVAVLVVGWSLADEMRLKQMALLRAFGVTESKARPLVMVEFSAIGAAAAGLSVLAAVAIGVWIAKALWEVNLPVRVTPLIGATIAATAGVVGLGWIQSRRLLLLPPLEVLRDQE